MGLVIIPVQGVTGGVCTVCTETCTETGWACHPWLNNAGQWATATRTGQASSLS
jgi:hypothetical protein